MPRRVLATLAVVGLLGLGAAESSPAAAQTSSTITLHGHGWGHGRGMGQYGAEGYARNFAWSAAQILDHFYGGTYAGAVANQQISVWLTARDGLDLHVTAGVPFRVAGYTMTPGQAVVIHSDGPNSYTIRGESSCGANDFPPVAVPGYVTVTPLEPPGNDLGRMLRLCGGASYRGELVLVHAEGTMRTTNVVHLEDYVRGVVPQESPPSFHAQALAAQAVAARSYAMASGGEFGNQYSYAKTCDTIACQVYRGAGSGSTRYEHPATDAAVAATAGSVRRFSSSNVLARTEFSSSTGGWTAGGDFPAVQDLGDAVTSNPRHNWIRALDTAQLGSRYGVGQFTGLFVTARNGLGDWGGRVLQVRIAGTSGSVTRTGDQFRIDWGLFSNWFSTEVGAPLEGEGPGAVATSAAAPAADIVARASNGSIRHLGPGGGAWAPLGGLATADPDVASSGDGSLFVFVRGTDGALYVNTRPPGGSFTGWSRLGGFLTSAPSAVSWAPGRIDVFVRGSDGAIWGLTFNGTWGAWYSLGGGSRGAPDVTSHTAGTLNVFIRGNDNQLWHRAFFNGGWPAWEPLGGSLTAGPGAAGRAGRVDVVGRAADGAAWMLTWAGSWGGWSPLGGGFVADLDVAALSGTGIDVVGRGFDGAIWRRSFRTGWGAWHSLGVPG